jgi:hypothetical protein
MKNRKNHSLDREHISGRLCAFGRFWILPLACLALFACDSGTTDGAVTKTYAIGDTGPAGGIVFYDKGSYSDDTLGTSWRYLECAPADLGTEIPWGPNDTTTVSTGSGVGTGASNTSAIIAAYGAAAISDINCAAKACADYSRNGYSDWFLPSKEELDQLYNNMVLQGLGSFVTTSGSFYWSSSQYSNTYSWACLLCENSGQRWFITGPMHSSTTYHVRAIREF